jgi:hypothetical protein
VFSVYGMNLHMFVIRLLLLRFLLKSNIKYFMSSISTKSLRVRIPGITIALQREFLQMVFADFVNATLVIRNMVLSTLQEADLCSFVFSRMVSVDFANVICGFGNVC